MKNLIVLILLIIPLFVYAQSESGYRVKSDISYYGEEKASGDNYIRERCKLDIYYPVEKDFPTIVWFHGGGLRGGEKEIPEALKEKGIALVGVNYRLHPKVKNPEYLKDAAASVAWVFNNISRFGGDSTLIFIAGHSAGGYLAAMLGLDKKWLGEFEIDANNLAGIIPFSGNAVTHITIRKERGIRETQPIIDEYAPLFHVRNDAPPLLLITGDRELELFGRYEENLYLYRMMKVVGHNETRILELQGYDHMMTEPAFPLLLNEVKRITEKIQEVN